MTPIVAGAFGTFALFLGLGLLALVVTAALDALLGKERALFVYALGLLALTAFVLRPEAPAATTGRPPAEKLLATLPSARTLAQDLVGRPPFEGSGAEARRNGFRRWSDTRPLPPVTLDTPPEIPLEFPLPPTVPGPAPAARRLLRGTVPALPEADASSPIDVPVLTFTEYAVKPDDVYDWVEMTTSPKVFCAIVAINGVRASDPKFRALQRQLAAGEDLERMTVEWAYIGSEKEASKSLDPASVARRSKVGRSTDPATDKKFVSWHLKRSVENEYDDAVRQALGSETVEATQNLAGLKRAAERMAGVGRDGKEGGEGWRRAAKLLARALEIARANVADRNVEAELLVSQVEAFRALNDETAVLQALTQYAAAAPTNARPWVLLGELALTRLHLFEDALGYFAKARSLDPGNEAAILGEGDAYTRLGRHAEALQAYDRAAGSYDAQVRRAEAALRLGNLAKAMAAAEAALQQVPDAPRALLVRGAVLYTKGTDLGGAKSAFQMAAVSSAEAGVWRAQALYDLGLACWRLGETRAAAAAFDACEAALRMGAAPSRFPDETVSPSLGRALVAFAMKPADPAAPPAAAPDPAAPAAPALTVHREGLGEYLAAAREEARRSCYLEHFAGVLASSQGNASAAIKSLRRALLLAPDATELDGWLALNHLRWAFARASRPEGSVGGGASRDREERRLEAILAQKAEDHFEAAVAFAARASDGDVAADPKSTLAVLRETWVRLQAEHLSPRKRFELALAAVEKVLARSDQREHPAALALRGYGFYRQGGDDNYDKCLRDLALVLDKVPDKPEAPWSEWRAYAAKTLARVAHWRSLEEKTISFEGQTKLTPDWHTVENGGVQLLVEGGALSFGKQAARNGSILEPNVVLINQTLFEKNTFEELSLRVSIPTTGAGGAVNNVVFGIGVQGVTSTSGAGAGAVPARHPGVAVFYDKAKVAARIGTGILKEWKDGEVKRVRDEAGNESTWPQGDWVTIRVVREDAAQGLVSIYFNDDEKPVVSDRISGFKGASGKAELWIGGWSATAMPFDIKVKDIRIVRVKK